MKKVATRLFPKELYPLPEKSLCLVETYIQNIDDDTRVNDSMQSCKQISKCRNKYEKKPENSIKDHSKEFKKFFLLITIMRCKFIVFLMDKRRIINTSYLS